MLAALLAGLLLCGLFSQTAFFLPGFMNRVNRWPDRWPKRILSALSSACGNFLNDIQLPARYSVFIESGGRDSQQRPALLRIELKYVDANGVDQSRAILDYEKLSILGHLQVGHRRNVYKNIFTHGTGDPTNPWVTELNKKHENFDKLFNIFIRNCLIELKRQIGRVKRFDRIIVTMTNGNKLDLPIKN